MTKQQAIKKYNLIKLEQKEDFDKQHNIETWRGEIEDGETKKIYTMTDEFSKVMGDTTPTFFLIQQIIYKNKFVRWGKTDSYRHKTITRTYEIKRA